MNKKIIGKEEFFEEISANANYCDKRLVENMYYGLIKVVSRHLKSGEEVKLPDWGYFYLHNTAPRQCINLINGKIGNLSMKRCVKFRPCTKVKAFFREL